jgi:hypothetical protein
MIKRDVGRGMFEDRVLRRTCEPRQSKRRGVKQNTKTLFISSNGRELFGLACSTRD